MKVNPCSSCGNKDIVALSNSWSPYVYCYCGDCDAEGPYFFDTQEEAIEAWNEENIEEFTWNT